MKNDTTPATAPRTTTPQRAPRTISHTHMNQHRDNGLATELASPHRYRIFIHYDNTWWISDNDSYIEITDPTHNAKLDRWHQRLTNGALWI